MAHEKFSSSEESTLEQIQGENHDCFFDSRGIVHKEFVPPGQTINHTFYKEALERLRKGSSESEQTLQTIGWCNTITCQLTLRFQLRISGEENHSRTSTFSLKPRSSSVRFLALPYVEIEVEGSSFQYDGKHTKNCK